MKKSLLYAIIYFAFAEVIVYGINYFTQLESFWIYVPFIFPLTYLIEILLMFNKDKIKAKGMSLYSRADELEKGSGDHWVLFGLILKEILIFYQKYFKNSKPKITNPIFIYKAIVLLLRIGKMISIFKKDIDLFNKTYVNILSNYQLKISNYEKLNDVELV